jgi:hypothetical protein
MICSSVYLLFLKGSSKRGRTHIILGLVFREDVSRAGSSVKKIN